MNLNPKIKLNGIEYTAPNPKTKLWREVTKIQKLMETENGNFVDFYESILNLIVLAFDNQEITVERIEDELDAEEIIPTFKNIAQWITTKVLMKTNEIPNE